MELHELCDLLPKMKPEEFEELVENIRMNGQKEPVYTYEGKIIDGRHRFLACQRLGIKVKTREWN